MIEELPTGPRRRANLVSQLMRVDANKASELQKLLDIERTKNQRIQAELKELNLDIQLDRRERNALRKECRLLREWVIHFLRIIHDCLPLKQLGIKLDALLREMGTKSEDDERSLLGDWSDTTTEDSGSAGESSANDRDKSWLDFSDE